LTAVRVGLVSEGKTDFEIVRWAIGEALATEGIDADFLPLQPVPDRTSGTHSGGGWHTVYQWCLRNDAVARKRFFGGGLFAGVSDDVDILIVHIDGDIHQVFLAVFPGREICSAEPSEYSVEPTQTFAFCTEILKNWMYGAQGRAEDDHTFPAPVVMASEAWLIGGLGFHDQPDTIAAPKEAFARLWLLSQGRPVPPTIRKLKRHASVIKVAIEGKTADLSFADKTAAFIHAVNTIRAYAR